MWTVGNKSKKYQEGYKYGLFGCGVIDDPEDKHLLKDSTDEETSEWITGLFDAFISCGRMGGEDG